MNEVQRWCTIRNGVLVSLFYDTRLSSKCGFVFFCATFFADKTNYPRSKHTTWFHEFPAGKKQRRLRYHQNPIQIYFCENHGDSGNMVPYAWQVTTSLASSKEQGWLFSGVANVKPQLKSLPLYHYHQHNTVMRIMIMMLMIIIMIINLLLTTRCFGKLQNWWRSWKLLLRQFQCIKNYWTCGSSHHLSKHLKSMPNLNWIPPPS